MINHEQSRRVGTRGHRAAAVGVPDGRDVWRAFKLGFRPFPGGFADVVARWDALFQDGFQNWTGPAQQEPVHRAASRDHGGNEDAAALLRQAEVGYVQDAPGYWVSLLI